MKYLMLFVIMVGFSSCSCKSIPLVQCEIVTTENSTITYVPTKCEQPKTFCDNNGTLQEGTVAELLRCIYELRQSKEVCN